MARPDIRLVQCVHNSWITSSDKGMICGLIENFRIMYPGPIKETRYKEKKIFLGVLCIISYPSPYL